MDYEFSLLPKVFSFIMAGITQIESVLVWRWNNSIREGGICLLYCKSDIVDNTSATNVSFHVSA